VEKFEFVSCFKTRTVLCAIKLGINLSKSKALNLIINGPLIHYLLEYSHSGTLLMLLLIHDHFKSQELVLYSVKFLFSEI
jgi:hypothetical protein